MVAKFDPDNEDLKFDIMNLLEDRLKHASSSVLLGAVKVFLNLTKDDKVLSKDVNERLAAPLITIMASAGTTENYEICYNVISHIYFLCLKGGADFFKLDFKQFFLKFDEPSYIKFLKLDVISLIATEDNVQEVLTELEEYVSDANSEIAKKAIRCFGDIVIRLDNFDDNISIIKNFLALKTDYITCECLQVLKNIFRKYKEAIEEFEDFLSNITFESMTEVEAKTAYIWILGEFGSQIEMAPYILERMIEIQKDLQSVEISMELLTSLTKLFFTRSPEVKEMLGKFLKFAISENNDADLRDRAAFYYKLIKSDVNLAKKIIFGESSEGSDFYKDTFSTEHATHDDYMREEVLKIKSKGKKIKPRGEAKKESKTEEETQEVTEDTKEDEDGLNLIDFGEDEPAPMPRKEPSVGQTASAFSNLLGDDEDVKTDDPMDAFKEVKPSESNSPGNLLEMDTPNDGAGLIDLSDAFGGSPPSPQIQPQGPQLRLSNVANLDPNSFQKKWMGLSNFPQVNRKANMSLVQSLQAIIDMLAKNNII